ncbi:MAG TPA: tetratricopeptide repeat protein [Blastocatellia bacterium]|nr:tetratricopeptide repeat protein [Blastocatellia bacterium]
MWAGNQKRLRSGIAGTAPCRLVLFTCLLTATGPRFASENGFVALPRQNSTERISQLVAQGVASLERGDLQAASRSFQEILKLNPKDVTALTYLGVIADRSGQLAEAERYFAAVVDAAPNSPSALNNYGAVLLKQSRTDEAAVQFEKSLRLDSSQPSALINLAQIRSTGTADDLRKGREMFERAFALAPDAEIARALVVIALRVEDKEAAAKYFREYSSRLAGANAQLTNTRARAELGGALGEAGLLHEAVTELTAAVTADPSNVDAILRLARAQIALGEIRSAGRTLESAVARRIESAPIYALLATVYELSGHVENAIPAMRLAIERDPQSEQYRFAYGMLLANSVAPKAAVVRLEEAIQLFPKSARLWLALGIAHFKAGANDRAASALERAIELDSKFAPAFAYLGMTKVEIGQYDEAVKLYEQALALNEKLGVVNYLIADVYLRQGSTDTARIEASLDRAVKWEPSFVPARLSLGKLYSRTNRLAEAADQFERAIKLDPDLAEAYYQLGRVYSRQKRTSDAQATLAKFKTLSDSQKEQEEKERSDIVRRLANVRF